ncbi:MAG: hypothetical protein P1U46_01430 [Patescibacteria group bacterium]|nr:hypothetical protein [Patescibacteria group bacterium]
MIFAFVCFIDSLTQPIIKLEIIDVNKSQGQTMMKSLDIIVSCTILL